MTAARNEMAIRQQTVPRTLRTGGKEPVSAIKELQGSVDLSAHAGACGEASTSGRKKSLVADAPQRAPLRNGSAAIALSAHHALSTGLLPGRHGTRRARRCGWRCTPAGSAVDIAPGFTAARLLRGLRPRSGASCR